MRKYALALSAAALFAFPALAWSQGVEVGPGGIRVHPGYDHPYHGRSVGRWNCHELRRACLNKEELGEEGQGNCQRYRHFCRGE